MSLRDLALEEATLKALADFVKDRLTEVRSELQSGLDAAEKESGTRQISVTLPGSTTPIATVGMTDPKPEARVVDLEAFTAWVVREYPGEIERRFVTEVRPAFLDKLLAEMTAAGVPRVLDTTTGQLHSDVPGVTVKATRSRNHSLRFKPDGRKAIGAAWQAGSLSLPGITVPAAVEGGEA